MIRYDMRYASVAMASSAPLQATAKMPTSIVLTPILEEAASMLNSRLVPFTVNLLNRWMEMVGDVPHTIS